MSMRRDDFSGLPSLNSSEMISHVQNARTLRSQRFRTWFGLQGRTAHPRAQVVALRRTMPDRTASPTGESTARHLFRGGPDCIRYAV